MLLAFVATLLSCGNNDETYTLKVKNPFTFDVQFNLADETDGLILAGEEKSYTRAATGEKQIYVTEVDDDPDQSTVVGKTATFTPEPGKNYNWRAGSETVSEEGSTSGKDCNDDPAASEYKDRINGDENGCQPCAACSALACAIYLNQGDLIDLYEATVKQEEEYYGVQTCPELY